jgi:polysaccharide pyruvyl transferase WcaK-like protein
MCCQRERFGQQQMPPPEKCLSQTLFSKKVRTGTKRHGTRVAFLGHFGRDNIGNESTLQSILYQLGRRVPDAEFACICTGPAATATTHNIRALPISRPLFKAQTLHNGVVKLLRSLFIGVPSELYRWLEAFMTLKGTDVFIVPGTGLLTDAYGVRGWGPYSTFKWSVVAKLRGCKLLFISVGAGPIYSRFSKFFVKTALGLADFRSYRDVLSLRYLESIGFVPTNDQVYPDLVFSFPQNVIPHENNSNKTKCVVGLGLMEYAGRYSVANPSSTTYRNYLENLVIFASWLLSRGYDVRLLIGDSCDRAVVEEFRGLLNEQLSVHDSGRIIDEPAASVEQLLSQLASTDMVVATRFHNVLLALLLHKPVMSISFHHKCVSLMSQMGLSEYCQDINDLKADRLIEQFCHLEKNAGSLGPMIRQKVEACRKALDEQYHLILQGLEGNWNAETIGKISGNKGHVTQCISSTGNYD